jgi:hypothetical protein
MLNQNAIHTCHTVPAVTARTALAALAATLDREQLHAAAVEVRLWLEQDVEHPTDDLVSAADLLERLAQS